MTAAPGRGPSPAPADEAARLVGIWRRRAARHGSTSPFADAWLVAAVELETALAALPSPGQQEAEGPTCRYCGADCSGGRSWDGGSLYACPRCAALRSHRDPAVRAVARDLLAELAAARSAASPDGGDEQ